MDYKMADSPLYKLLMSGQQHKFFRGQTVDAFSDRAKVHLINKGYVERYLITNDGSRSIQVIYGPNDIFPLPPVYKQVYKLDIYRGPETYYYEAITDILVHSIGLAELESALEKDPQVYRDLFYIAGERLNSYIHRLEDLSLRVASRRVAHQLLYLADKFGEETPEGVKIMLPLTHQTLAEILSMARETVTHSISSLQKKQLVTTEGKNIVLLDVEKLKAMVR